MKLLIKGLAVALILMAAIQASAQNKAGCKNDKELEVACKTALEAADELLRQKEAKEIYLESVIKHQQSQFETQTEMLVDLLNPPWHANPRYTFLLGVITTGVLYESISRYNRNNR